MKLKVIGWTEYDDTRFPDGECSWAARQAIIDDIKEHGYDFTGWHHQEMANGAPILSDGKMRRYSQRGWGSVMAEANGYNMPMDYVYYSFYIDETEETKAPEEDRNLVRRIYDLAGELLDEEACETFFSGDFTLHFPHPELDDRALYTLTPEEAEEIGHSNTVRQLPGIIYKALFPKDLHETYVLKEEECEVTDAFIRVMQRDELRFMDKGDTVIVGDKSYIVRDVDPKLDVSADIINIVSDRNHPKYKKACEKYQQAGVVLTIKTE